MNSYFEDDKKYIEDSVGTFSNWYTRGPVYELPFRALCGRNIKNLYAAGRIIGADDRAWYNTRVIPICAVSGEAAGKEAKISLAQQTDAGERGTG